MCIVCVSYQHTYNLYFEEVMFLISPKTYLQSKFIKKFTKVLRPLILALRPIAPDGRSESNKTKLKQSYHVSTHPLDQTVAIGHTLVSRCG